MGSISKEMPWNNKYKHIYMFTFTLLIYVQQLKKTYVFTCQGTSQNFKHQDWLHIAAHGLMIHKGFSWGKLQKYIQQYINAKEHEENGFKL